MNKRLIAIVVAASLVVVGIWYFALFSPQSKSLHKANVQTAASKSQAAGLRSQIAVLQQEKTQLPAAQTKLTTLALDLPATPALDKLVDDINADAAQSGVDWQSVSPSKPAAYTAAAATASGGFVGGMQPISVSLQVNGSYHQVTDFVTKLNGISRLFVVNSVNFSGVGATVAKVSTQIVGQVFYVPAAAGSTTTTVAP